MLKSVFLTLLLGKSVFGFPSVPCTILPCVDYKAVYRLQTAAVKCSLVPYKAISRRKIKFQLISCLIQHGLCSAKGSNVVDYVKL